MWDTENESEIGTAEGHSSLLPSPATVRAVLCRFPRDPVRSNDQSKVIVAAQAGYEEEALSIKFESSRENTQHNACKRDLLDMPHRDKDLMAQTDDQR